MKRKRKLLVAVPTRAHGSIHSELHWWLTALAVEAEQKRLLDILTADLDVFSRTKREIEKCRESVGGAWMTRLAMFQWANRDIVASMRGEMIPEGWDVHHVTSGEYPVPANRNSICRQFLFTPDYANADRTGTTGLVKTDYDVLLMVDSDIVPGAHDLRYICESLDADDGRAGVVSGVYHMVNDAGRPIPIVYESTGPGTWRDRPGKSANLLLVDGPPLRTADGVGVPGGFLAIRREVLEEMAEKHRIWFKDRYADGSLETFEIDEVLSMAEKDPAAAIEHLAKLHGSVVQKEWGEGKPGNWALGEDLWFSRQVQELGYEVWVDRRIVLRHWKDCDQRSVNGALELAHLEGFMRGRGMDPNDPAELKEATGLWRAMLGEQAKTRDAEMRKIVNAAHEAAKLQKETAA